MVCNICPTPVALTIDVSATACGSYLLIGYQCRCVVSPHAIIIAPVIYRLVAKYWQAVDVVIAEFISLVLFPLFASNFYGTQIAALLYWFQLILQFYSSYQVTTTVVYIYFVKDFSLDFLFMAMFYDNFS